MSKPAPFHGFILTDVRNLTSHFFPNQLHFFDDDYVPVLLMYPSVLVRRDTGAKVTESLTIRETNLNFIIKLIGNDKRVNSQQSIFTDTLADVALFFQRLVCLTSHSNCYSFVINSLNRKTPRISMRITSSFKYTWFFRDICFLAWEVVLQVRALVFVCKNTRFSAFLNFKC